MKAIVIFALEDGLKIRVHPQGDDFESLLEDLVTGARDAFAAAGQQWPDGRPKE